MLSPRTEAASASQQSADAETLFKNQFTQMAMDRFVAEHPDLASNLESFDPFQVDLDNSTGVGMYRVRLGDGQVHVPVVLSGSKLQSPDSMLVPGTEQMLPFTKDFVDMIKSKNNTSMGAGGNPPDTMAGDMSIRNVMQVPETGRASYASALPFKIAQQRAVATALPQLLVRASNATKTAFVERVMSRKKLARHFVSRYGMEVLRAALQHTQAPAMKVAAAPAPLADVEVLTIKEAAAVPQVFGIHADSAWRSLSSRGWAAIDRRREGVTKMALCVSHCRNLVSLTRDGVVQVIGQDGGTTEAIVITRPKDLRPPEPGSGGDIALRHTTNTSYYPGRLQNSGTARDWEIPRDSTSATHIGRTPALLLTEDGSFIWSPGGVTDGISPMAESAATESALSAWTRHLDRMLDVPKTGLGVFVKNTSRGAEVTLPVEVLSVTRHSDGGWDAIVMIDGATFARQDKIKVTRRPGFAHEKVITLHVPPGAGDVDGISYRERESLSATEISRKGEHAAVAMLPMTWQFLPLSKRERTSDFIWDEHGIREAQGRSVEAAGGIRVSISIQRAGTFVNGQHQEDMKTAAEHLMHSYELEAPSAAFALDLAARTKTATIWAISRSDMLRMMAKVAAPVADATTAQQTGGEIDPETGLEIDPETGLLMEPQSGMLVDIEAQLFVNPETLEYIDPETGEPTGEVFQGGAPAAAGGDPAAAGMADPAAAGMAASAPPPPTPTELAVADINEILMAQGEELQRAFQTAQEKLEAQLMVLQMVQARTQANAEGAGPMAYGDLRNMAIEHAAQELAAGQAPGLDADMGAGMAPDPMMQEEAGALAPAPMDPAVAESMVPSGVDPSQMSEEELMQIDAAAAGAVADTVEPSDQIGPDLLQNFIASLDAASRVLLELKSGEVRLRQEMGDSLYEQTLRSAQQSQKHLGTLVSAIYRQNGMSRHQSQPY